MHCDNTPVEYQGVAQFAADSNIKDYPEIDLFGYMKTVKGGNQSTRSAVVRLSNAISLKPYASETDFLTNMGIARRAGVNNAIAQSEIHSSLYTYTIAIDLDRVGIDGDIAVDKNRGQQELKNYLTPYNFFIGT